jgi:tetratricopeptide (TPR) repeat protein/DNA-binding CsgD family transcriptional regulator
MYRKINFLIILLLFFSASVLAQHNVKSLDSDWDIAQQIDSLCAWSWDLRSSDNEQAMEYASLAIKKAEKTEDKTLLTKAYFQMASVYYNLGESQKALAFYKKADKNADSNTEPLLLARIYNGIGLSNVDLTNYDTALIYYEKAKDIYIETDDLEGVALQLQNIGVVYDLVGRTEEALKHYLSSLSILEALPNPRLSILANNYMNTAIVFMNIGDNIKALVYFRKSEDSYARSENLNGLALLYTNIGVFYFTQNLDSSLYYHSKALKIFQQTNKKSSEAVALSYIADIHRERGEFEEAFIAYNQAIEIIESQNFIYGEIICRTGLGRLERLMNKPLLSIESLKKAISLAVSIDALYLERDATKELALSYASMNNYKEAYETFVQYKELSDELLNIERLELIKSLEFSYETEKKQREIDKLKAEKKIIELRTKIFIITSVLILVFLIFVINRQRLIRKKERMLAHIHKELANEKIKAAESELDLRKKILLNYALRITEKNTLLSDIHAKLKEINPKIRKEVSDILSSIQMNLLLPGDKEELDKLINQSGASFFSKLDSLSGNLTDTEKRLCVFLSFGFSSKDISGIMNISPKTIDNYRSSIRRKLKIDDTIKLSMYLENL